MFAIITQVISGKEYYMFLDGDGKPEYSRDMRYADIFKKQDAINLVLDKHLVNNEVKVIKLGE